MTTVFVVDVPCKKCGSYGRKRDYDGLVCVTCGHDGWRRDAPVCSGSGTVGNELLLRRTQGHHGNGRKLRVRCEICYAVVTVSEETFVMSRHTATHPNRQSYEKSRLAKELTDARTNSRSDIKAF